MSAEHVSRCIVGDCRTVLQTLPDASVHTCVTSPPYWGLRDYGTGQWEGGDPACDHIAGMARGDTDRETPGGKGGSFRGGTVQFTDRCGKCGAQRVDSQLGLESVMDCLGWATGERCGACFVCHMVDVFREVRRVLREDGTLWLNLGDSYAGAPGGFQGKQNSVRQSRTFTARIDLNKGGSWLKAKDLCMVPARVAIALQADGWYLRQDIIWSKPNPMPESVRDRCTKSHEYIFLLSKSDRYYFDQEAILEPVSKNTHARLAQNVEAQVGSIRANGGTRADRPFKAAGRKSSLVDRNGRNTGVGWDRTSMADPADNRKARGRIKNNPSFEEAMALQVTERNKRSVWTVTTKPYSEAHFATFPPELIEPCILAGCPVGGVVLDPFFGSGTTGEVSERLGRKWLGIELSPAYHKLAIDRTQQMGIQL